MAWVNYHSHSVFSDGIDEPGAFVNEALKQNMSALGFSSHAPIPVNPKWTMKHENLESYVLEIKKLAEEYSDKIQVYCGLEVDFIEPMHNEIMNFINKVKLDYIIGSIHYLGFFPDGESWNIDGSIQEFDKGYNEIIKADSAMLVSSFYENTRKMISVMKPDVVGHIDKIKLHNNDNSYFDESDKHYVNEILKTLELIKKNNTVVEVNTRGLYRHKNNQLYPSPWILNEIHKMDIPVTISSDCHKHSEITMGFDEAVRILEDIGFKSIRVLYNNKWIDAGFNSYGVCL